MFSKAFILILLGSTLALASPVDPPSINVSVIENLMKSVFEDYFNALDDFEQKKEANLAEAAKLGKGAAEYFKAKVSENEEAMSDKFAAADQRSGVQLEQVIDTGKIDEIEHLCKKARDTIAEIMKEAKRKLDDELENAKQLDAKTTEKKKVATR